MKYTITDSTINKAIGFDTDKLTLHIRQESADLWSEEFHYIEIDDDKKYDVTEKFVDLFVTLIDDLVKNRERILWFLETKKCITMIGKLHAEIK